MIASISALRGGLSILNKSISTLAKLNLISRTKNAKYDGYRLTYGGLDYLALHALLKSGTLYSIGNQIGVGKESDIYVCASPTGRKVVLKIHRLGRISFRTVKANRDYLRNRNTGSWMHMSRLAALKEYTFMRSLHDAGFPVPEPLGWNRHAVVMELVDGFPLRQIDHVPDPAGLYAQLIEQVLRLAAHGLIHGDFNEFNILVEEKEEDAKTTGLSQQVPSSSGQDPESHPQSQTRSLPIDPSYPQTATDSPPHPAPTAISTTTTHITLNPIIIDFPQMLSTSHQNAAFYFDRDIACLKRFFFRRFGFESDEPGPFFADVVKVRVDRRLDVEAEASGFSKKMSRELQGYMEEVGVDGDGLGKVDVEAEGNEVGNLEENGDGNDVEECGGLEEVLTESLIDGEGDSSLSVKSPDEDDMVDGMMILKLADEKIPAAVSEIQGKEAMADLGATSDSKIRTHTAKAAKGWVI